MDQQFLVLDKRNPMAWALMPYALDRIRSFAVKYETNTDPQKISELIQQHFISDSPLLLVGVAYKKGVGVFSHVLAAIEDITGNRFLTIMQFETDIPFDDRSGLDRIWNQLKLWGVQNGAESAHLITKTEKQARVFRRYYGFTKERIVMRKSLLEGN